MKATKKALSFLFALILLVNLPFVCRAEPVRYWNIQETSASLSISGLTAKCNSSLSTSNSASLSITMVLQKNTSSGYTDVQTWTKTGTGTYLSMEKSKTINIFNSYRLKVTFTAGDESETVYRYA